MKQLSLFEEIKKEPKGIKITYWAKPYNKAGELKPCLKKWEETKFYIGEQNYDYIKNYIIRNYKYVIIEYIW